MKIALKSYILNKSEQTVFRHCLFSSNSKMLSEAGKHCNAKCSSVKVLFTKLLNISFDTVMSWTRQLRPNSWRMHPKGSNWAGNFGYHGVTVIGSGCPSSFIWQGEWLKLAHVHMASYITLRDNYNENRILSYPENTLTSPKARNCCSNHMSKYTHTHTKSIIIKTCFLIQTVCYM